LVEIPVEPGAFFDLTPVHVLTTTSLATMGAAHPESDWSVRRFRPNLLVDTSVGQAPIAVPDAPVPPGTAHPGFPEDGWVGSAVAFGPSGNGAATTSVWLAPVCCARP